MSHPWSPEPSPGALQVGTPEWLCAGGGRRQCRGGAGRTVRSAGPRFPANSLWTGAALGATVPVPSGLCGQSFQELLHLVETSNSFSLGLPLGSLRPSEEGRGTSLLSATSPPACTPPQECHRLGGHLCPSAHRVALAEREGAVAWSDALAEAEAGGLLQILLPAQHNEFRTSLNNKARPCFKNKKRY